MTSDPDRARALLALAERVCAEEPSRELDADIWDTTGLTDDNEAHGREWCRRNALPRRRYLIAWSPAYTTDLNAAAGAMPEGWRIWEIQQDASGFDVALFNPSRNPWIARVRAPDEPRARTAAALRAMAAEVGA
jgi:hypothetical protein